MNVFDYLRSKRHVAINVIIVIVYAILYDYVYENYICVIFDYEESAQHEVMTNVEWASYLIVAFIPILFYNGIKTIASAISLFIYVFAYIPMINNLFTWGYPVEIINKYVVVLLISMSIFFLTDNLYLCHYLIRQKSRLIPFLFLERLILLLFVVLVITQRGNIHFVNFLVDSSELYDLRASNSMGGNYLIAWLRSAFIPLLMVCYLHTKQYKKYALSFAAYIVIFMIDMQKLTFIYPFVLTGMYFFATYNEKLFCNYFHVFLISIISLVSVFLLIYIDNPICFAISAIFIMRTQCIEGMELSTYLRFFELGNHPFTYYNHIGIVNLLTDANPYNEAIGLVVTEGGSNANGTFWLMDGVAAAGVMGIVIISILFVLVKSIINTMDTKCSIVLCICIMLNGIQFMVNVSLFTALNTCGFILLFLIFKYFDLSILSVGSEEVKVKEEESK